MPQASDIVLDGASYMLRPGSYTRQQDGIAEGRVGRIVFRDFFGGTRRHLQLERDRAWASVGVGPYLNGQGVAPLGNMATFTTAALATAPDKTVRIPQVTVKGIVFFALGKTLYRVTTTGNAPAAVFTAPAPILDICVYAERGVYLVMGTGYDNLYVDVLGPSVQSQVLAAGEQGFAVGAYMGYSMWADARTTSRGSFVRMVTGTGVDTRILDHQPVRFQNAGAKIYVLSKGGVYSYSGRVTEQSDDNPAYVSATATPNEPPTKKYLHWSGEFEPFHQNGTWAGRASYACFEGYGNRIFAWLEDRVMEFRPGSDSRAGWHDTGLQGSTCTGACVAGNWLIVTIISLSNNSEIWGYDGNGWWCFASKPSATTGDYCWPVALGDNWNNRDFFVFRHGDTTNIDLWRVSHREPARHAYPQLGVQSFTTSMLDAQQRDRTKAWRKVGAIFATPELSGIQNSLDTVGCDLYYSADAGATWTQAKTYNTSPNTLLSSNFEFEVDLSGNAPTSKFLMLRVDWRGVYDWSPVLVGLWAEFEIMDAPSRRRRWHMDVIAQDQTIDRNGQTLALTGRQLIAQLWNSWQKHVPLMLRDIDYDADPTQRTVRVIGIKETTQKPSDAGRWGDSLVTLDLVEV